jgi:hypothetical protein
MSSFHEEQAKRLYGLDEMEAEALEVLRLMVRQTERGENLDADLVERAKAIVERYDRTMIKGHEAPGVVPFRRDEGLSSSWTKTKQLGLLRALWRGAWQWPPISVFGSCVPKAPESRRKPQVRQKLDKHFWR